MTDDQTAGIASHGHGPFIAAIDQGTTSSRCIVFDPRRRLGRGGQKGHAHKFPHPGGGGNHPTPQ
ncbi:hypothetical protein ACFWH4_28675 [Streptomyces sp. NPDC127091]|uniref:hypothetical protein n=1 Tax=Streptomyces sp. NPDC127091 TaxID=3347134 RepID=UPI00364B5056